MLSTINKTNKLLKYGQMKGPTHSNNIIITILCHIGGVMGRLVSWNVVCAWSVRLKDYKIGICCFSAKHATLRSKIKDCLAQYQNNVSEWSKMSTADLTNCLFGIQLIT